MIVNWIKRLSSHFRKDGNFFLAVAEITGQRPNDLRYYQLAFRHSSASRQQKGKKLNNQRLEFLGDAILGAVVANYLYQRYPKAGEGFLTNMRSKIVSRKHLNQLGIKLQLNKLVVKKTSRTANAKSIYGDAFEALIGALYLDKGFAACEEFIEQKVMRDHVSVSELENRIASHKGAILEWGQKNKHEVNFEVTASYGESHARKYEVLLTIDGNEMSTGKGSSKKKAEEDASRAAYKKISARHGKT